MDVWAGITIGCLSVLARSISLTFPVVLLAPEELLFAWDFCVSKLVSSPNADMTLGGSFSGAGKARSEFADDGDREHNPRQFGAVSNTCNCCGDAVKVYTLNII